MIKNDLIDELYREFPEINKRDIAKYVDFIFEEMSDGLQKDGNVKITNFGSFEIRNKNARIGRNPRTMEEVEISARKVVSFRPSENLVKKLNSHEADEALSARQKSIDDLSDDE